MTFEDRLRDQFRRADASVPGDRIDWNTTITKARRQRMKFAALIAVAAASILGIGAYAITNLNDTTASIGPAGGGPPDVTTSSSQNPSIERGSCSAYDMDSIADEQPISVPTAVRETRQTILQLATDCEYMKLESLALRGDPNFQYTYGVEKSPARFWQAREAKEPSQRYMRALVSIMRLPHCKETGPDGKVYYVWPRANCSTRTTSDWDDLKGMYTDEQIQQMRTGDIYYGFRVGILENGDWVYFISGD